MPPSVAAQQPNDRYDVVIAGGGHNGLTAAAYLARAGLSVLLLERSAQVGGAAVSAQPFAGVDARLSRYSYLVSLMPRQLIDDLDLRLTLKRRRFASYTPVPGGDRGLLVDRGDSAATAESFAAIGARGDVEAWGDFYDRVARLARAWWPTFTEPLRRRRDLSAMVEDPTLIRDFIDTPLGEVIEATFTSDLVRGVALTDALIGTFAAAHEGDLRQNACFLYHVIGGGTGDWDVPVGGMSEVSGQLEAAARRAGAHLRANADVVAVDEDRVRWREPEDELEVRADQVLWAAAPAVLDELRAAPGTAGAERVEGAQVKVNLLLSRLPRLLDERVAPEAAFGGTFHINQAYSQLEGAHAAALRGRVPDPIPAEIYCHSLSDPSILSPQLQRSGAHTLTVFAVHVPDRLLDGVDHDAMRAHLQRGVLDSLSSVLAEPIESVLLRDAHGRPCIETKTTRDLADSLRMPGGNIFHGPLSWPFVDDDARLDTPAQRWGVESGHGDILLAGAGTRRGGGVSGLGGYHAARAVFELRS